MVSKPPSSAPAPRVGPGAVDGQPSRPAEGLGRRTIEHSPAGMCLAGGPRLVGQWDRWRWRSLTPDRASTPGPWVLFGALLVSVLVTGAIAVFLYINSGTPVAKSVGNLGLLLASFVAGLACVRAARRGGPEGRGWALLASAMFIWATAAALWFWYGISRDHDYPFPAVADIGFVGYAVPAAAALLAFPRDPQPLVSRARALVDGALIATSVLFLSSLTVLAPLSEADEEGLKAVTVFAYPVVDVLISSLVLVLGLRRPPHARLMWVLLGGGLLVLSVTDSLFVGSLVVAGEPMIGTPLQAGWVASFLLISLAAVVSTRAAGAHRPRPFAVSREVLPYLPVLLVILVVGTRENGVTPSAPFQFWLGVLLLAVLILHQLMLAVEKTALADDLTVLAEDLEDQVATRTSELVVARNEAVAASQAKSGFLAAMSHEIRTPMNGVIGLTWLLLHGDLGEKERGYVEGLQRAGTALLATINNILDFSKVEAGKIELEMVDFDLVQVVEEAAELVAQEAQRKELELLAYCSPEVPVMLRGDPSRVRQVLVNLVSNAVKFTDDGEVVLRAHLDDQWSDRVMVRFEVTDTGIGLGEPDQDRLFESFTQADATTTRRFGGTGLGLAICRQLVDAMGGSLGVDSEPGRGSTFWFTLPLGIAAHQSPTSPRTDGDLAGVRVLVVDDNETNRLILDEQLRAWGMRPQVVGDGPTALDALEEAAATGATCALVLMDMCMPGMDGLELARRIRADNRFTEVGLVLLTSASDVPADEARDAGISTWLSKPVHLSHLYTALTGALTGARGTTESREVACPAGAEPRPARILGHVLVAEDNQVNQLVAVGMLENLGYTCEVAANGLEALEALRRRPFAAVLMDCHMPEMDGYDATRAIRALGAEHARVPVIAMTASVTQDQRAQCLTAGMDDFISKPVDTQLLAATLDRCLAARQPHTDSDGDGDGNGNGDLTDADAEGPGAQGPGAEGAGNDVVLDLARLEDIHSLTPGDTSLVERLIESWATSAPEALRAIRAAVASRSADALVAAAHQLKGSAGNIGAHRVAAVCKELELLGESGDLEAAAATCPRLSREVDRAITALRGRHPGAAAGPSHQSPAGPTP